MTHRIGARQEEDALRRLQMTHGAANFNVSCGGLVQIRLFVSCDARGPPRVSAWLRATRHLLQILTTSWCVHEAQTPRVSGKYEIVN